MKSRVCDDFCPYLRALPTFLLFKQVKRHDKLVTPKHLNEKHLAINYCCKAPHLRYLRGMGEGERVSWIHLRVIICTD